MARKILFLFLVITASVTVVSSQSYAQKSKYTPQGYIDNVIGRDPNFKNAVYAVKAVDGNGKVIAEANSNLPLLTASNMKTISTGIALLCLGEDFRFTTKIAYSGIIKEGTLCGDLYIIGGGDPTLGSRDSVAYGIDSIFGVWANAVKGVGINKIEGRIVVDDSYFERETIPDNWVWCDLGYDYGSAPSGLTFNENLVEVKEVPSSVIGERAKVIIDYPEVPGFEYINDLSTAAAGSGDRSLFYVSDLAKVGRFTGTIPVDRDTVKNSFSNKFPHLSCGASFRDFLVAAGVKVGSCVVSADEISEEATLTPITETYSPPLWEIVRVCNRISNNLYAETLFKAVAKEMTGEGSYRAAKKFYREKMAELNLSTIGYTQDDGSGLSRENYVSPEFFCNFLSIMATEPFFEKYIESMPYVGVGTFEGLFSGMDIKYSSRVHAKSGSLSSVKCYSGYVYGGPQTGLIKFSILVNNFACPTREITRRLEGFMYSLACTP